MTDQDYDRLNDLERELRGPDAELRDLLDRLVATYKRRAGGWFVIDLRDRAAIRRRAEIRALVDENRFAYGAARTERDRLRRMARAEEWSAA